MTRRPRRDVLIDVRREPLSVKGRKGFKLWKVSFATFGGKRVWGLLSVPDDGSKGPWPLKVNVPGAGPACSEASAVTEAGTVTLVMNVHPFEPARTPKEQDAKYKAQDKRLVAKYGVTYATAGIAVSREECFFHDAILGIDRAVDWAAALPEVDRSRVWYYDGRLDVIAGPNLYLAPEFRPVKVRDVTSNVKGDGRGYADDFMNLPLDVNGDGRTDVISGGWFSKETCWAGNALPSTNIWKRHLIDRTGNIETGLLVDIDGDGDVDLVTTGKWGGPVIFENMTKSKGA